MKYKIRKLIKEGLKKYDWRPIEIEVANLAKSKGWKLTKDWGNGSKDSHYTLYDNPELEGAWTISNELIWSYDLSEIINYLKNH